MTRLQRLFYPVFAPMVGWMWILILHGAFTSQPSTETGPTGSTGWMAAAGLVLAPCAGALLQLVLGWPSALLLRPWRNLPLFLAAGGVLGSALALFLAYRFQNPQFGETALTALPYTATLFLPPFLLGYLRLYFLHPPKAAR